MDYIMTQYDYETSIIKTIDKMKEKIKIENEKIEDCNLNIQIYTDYLVKQINSLYVALTPNILSIAWRGFHKEKDEIEDKNKYKTCYDIIKDTIISDIISDTKCNYKKTKFIKDIICCGYESYAYNISFVVNNIEFVFSVPCLKNISKTNIEYANYGKYVLAYKDSSISSCYIITSYKLEDLAEAFKNFLEERENNNE